MIRLAAFLVLLAGGASVWSADSEAPAGSFAQVGPVYVLPIRQEVDRPLLYLIRRGVKEAMEAKASLLLLRMDTYGGRVDVTHEIIDTLNRFPGRIVTYVDTKAISAGAFISIATERIYMAPQSVIGAAAPIMVSPIGGAPESMPSTLEAKMTSALSAQVRASAAKNGHDTRVVQAMIDKGAELVVDGTVLSRPGEILTLTNEEAERTFGDPPKRLLSAGTMADVEAVLRDCGVENSKVVQIQATGLDRVANWINSLRLLFLLLGVVGLYMEFKTPGFGVFGLVGIGSICVYFMGGYLAGLAGMEWLAVFLVGVLLVAVEVFLIPGTLLAGLLGLGAMTVALVMAMVDVYPGGPIWPGMDQLGARFTELSLGLLMALAGVLGLGRVLPRTHWFARLVPATVSGQSCLAEQGIRNESLLGQEGVALSPLHPGGRARFGEKILDVTTDGPALPAGAPVRILEFRGYLALVEPADPSA